MTTASELQALKKKYADEGLRRETLHENPLQQFELWYEQAIDADLPEPNAMCVATATASAAPSQRTVLMKSYDHDGLVFYTNYDSRKAHQLAENDQVSLLFPWIGLHRQVIVEGRASRISAAESLRYFATRPRGSQLGAWSSHQSEVLSSRSLLEAKLDQIKRKFARGEVPCLRSGAATGSGPTASNSGRGDRTGCMTGFYLPGKGRGRGRSSGFRRSEFRDIRHQSLIT